jgi:hypothetical protein
VGRRRGPHEPGTAHDYAVLDADETAEFTRLCGSALDAVA